MPESVLHILERFVKRGTRLRLRGTRLRLRVASCHGGRAGWSDLSGRVGSHMCTPTGGEGGRTPSPFGSCFFSKVKKRKKKQGTRPLLLAAHRKGYTCVTQPSRSNPAGTH